MNNNPTPSEGLVSDLCAKWETYIPNYARMSSQSGQIALMLEAQKKYFDTALDERTRQYFVDLCGEQWDEAFLRAYAKAVAASKICSQVSVQPMSGPLHAVAFLTQGLVVDGSAVDALSRVVDENSDEVPEIRLKIETVGVAARNHPISAIFPSKEDMVAIQTAMGVDAPSSIMGTMLQEVIESRQRAVFGAIRDVAKEQTISPTDEDGAHRSDRIRGAIGRACYVVHKATMRGPSNRVVSGPALAPHVRSSVVAQKRATMHVDPMFPSDEIVCWYNGPSVIDSVAVWSPYVITARADDYKTTEEVDGERVEVMRSKLNIGMRDAITITNPSAAAMVKVPMNSDGTPLKNSPAVLTEGD